MSLDFTATLPPGYRVLNPFQQSGETVAAMKSFYKNYYSDQGKRKLLLGINPGRFGAGITGIPFTDTKRLENVCGIRMEAYSHEPSSVFVYEMIEAYGGAEKFFRQVYINSPFPLTLVRRNEKEKEVNANYYDDAALYTVVKDFMTDMLRQHLRLCGNPDTIYVLGSKNAVFIRTLNDDKKLFKEMVVLEHPRYIQQYKSREKDRYIQKYLDALL